MAGTVSLELDPIFLKGLGYLHSKSKDSAEKLKALLDESLARGSDSIYRTSLKVIKSQMYFYVWNLIIRCFNLCLIFHSLGSRSEQSVITKDDQTRLQILLQFIIIIIHHQQQQQ